MDQPIVSVIIPAYNPPSDGFQNCMESVLGQSYPAIEVILVDDGSTPASAMEMDTWAKRDPRVHVCHQPNGGVGSARNHGIELANGKYINFVDADDMAVDAWLESAVNEAKKKDADIVYGVVRMIDSASPGIQSDAPTKTCSKVYEQDELWRVQEMLLLNHGSSLPGLPYLDFGPCGKLFRADILKTNLFPIHLPLAEDQVFNHTLLRHIRRAVITNMPAYHYFAIDGSATHRGRADAVEILMRAMESIRPTLFDHLEIYHAFRYRYICEIVLGMQLAYFRGDDRSLTLRKRMRLVRQTLLLPSVREAWEKIDLQYVPDPKTKTKIQLMKKKLFLPLELFWAAKYVCQRKKDSL